MRKSRDRKWRHVYPYVCDGCGKKRIAFDNARAKKKECKVCEKKKPDENQLALPM